MRSGWEHTRSTRRLTQFALCISQLLGAQEMRPREKNRCQWPLRGAGLVAVFSSIFLSTNPNPLRTQSGWSGPPVLIHKEARRPRLGADVGAWRPAVIRSCGSGVSKSDVACGWGSEFRRPNALTLNEPSLLSQLRTGKWTLDNPQMRSCPVLTSFLGTGTGIRARGAPVPSSTMRTS